MIGDKLTQIDLAKADEQRRWLSRRWLVWVEQAWLTVESGVNRLIGSTRLNPFYHTGTITVYLLVLVLISGVYLTIFYRYGTTEAYESVKWLDSHWLGRLMRGVHRYASDAVIVFIILHTLREFFKDHFSGSRWLAWVSGLVLLVFTWITGLVGYWMVWDQRAQLINDGVTDILNIVPSMGGAFGLTFLTNERAQGLPLFFIILIFIHIFIPLIMGGLFWVHIIRLSRAKILPPRFQMISMGVILAGLALALPPALAEQADLARLPGTVGLDFYYLSYLPSTLRFAPITFWAISFVAVGVLTALPWLSPAKKMSRALVNVEECTGCTFCARDCPSTAITMIPRNQDKPHLQVALVDPKLCVSCGICTGSCAWDAVNMADWPATLVKAEIIQKLRGAADLDYLVTLVFTCQRHMAHGAPAVIDKINQQTRQSGHDEYRLIALPCVGMLVPTYISYALDAGASKVVIAGCPLEDCNDREGNLWLEEQLARQRAPYLKRKEHSERVRTVWLPPNERGWLGRALLNRFKWPELNRFHLARAVVLWLGLLVLIIPLADLPFQAYGPDQARLQVGLRHSSQFVQQQLISPEELAKLPQHLQLEQVQGTGRFPLRLVISMDGQVLLDNVYQAQGVRHDGAVFVLEKLSIPPRKHSFLVQVDDGGENKLRSVIEQTVEVKPGQVIVLSSDPVKEFVLLAK
ncbi:MAG: cytochrome b N-terminal domain-containing protein [Anaerolineae bacterium]